MNMVFLILSVGSALSAEPTQFILKNQPAPYDGYLVEQSRFEKTVIAIADLQSTKDAYALKTQLYELTVKQKELAEQKLELKTKESEAVETKLTEKIADLNVWWRKPWIVSLSTAAMFVLAIAL